MAVTIDGTNGVTFNDTSLQGAAASPYVLKNRLINGSMLIDQRNNGASTTAPNGGVTYVVDRWAVYTAGSNVTCQQVAGPNSYDKAQQLLPLTGNTITVFLQRIESKNCLDLPNKTVTVSGQIYIDSISGIACTVAGYAAASTDSTYTTAISGFNVSLTAGSYVSFSGQLSLPSTAYNGFEVDINFSGVVGRTIKITNVQLEVGTSATPFERRLYNQELANCQRYYEIGTAGWQGYSTNASNFSIWVQYEVQKRAAATLVVANSYNSGSWSSPSGSDGTINGFLCKQTSGSTAGNAYFFNTFTASSEL